MAQKHLHELLQEDQEPFHLNKYIADKHSQIKAPTQIQLKKPKSRQISAVNLCKNACFFSFTNSPDLTKSPLFEFKSPVRSPCKSPNNIFMHVPARTATLLLDAALRIQNNSNNNGSRRCKNSGFGLFGSMLKKLKQKSKTHKSSVQDILKWDSFVARKSFGQKGDSCELSNGRTSSAVWSESNEECKSSCCSTSHSDDADAFCESPFRFVLQRSPSPGCRTPEFSSPVASPGHYCRKQEKENYEDVISSRKFPAEEEEEDEDKDQFSPVSVLDPPFQDYEENHDGDYEDEDEGYGIQCNYENVQRAKQQLLQKLHRFEKLAELDPIELEKRISEQEYDENYDDETDDFGEGECDDNVFDLPEQISNSSQYVTEVCKKANLFEQHYIPKDMKNLILDLITEEEQTQSGLIDRELTVTRVCQRLESWKDVEFNTIDMMVEQDLNRDRDWKNHQNHVGEVALEVEVAIFGLLVEELSDELMQ